MIEMQNSNQIVQDAKQTSKAMSQKSDSKDSVKKEIQTQGSCSEGSPQVLIQNEIPDCNKEQTALDYVEDLNNKEKRHLVQFLLRLALHYTNLILSLIVYIALLKNWAPNGVGITRFIYLGIIGVLGIIFERFTAFRSMLACKRIVKQNLYKIEEMNFCEKFKIFIHTLTYSDIIYHQTDLKLSRMELSSIKYQQFYFTIFFDFLITLFNLSYLIEEELNGQRLPIFYLIAFFFSFLNTVHGFSQFYLFRGIEQQLFMDKIYVKFIDMSDEQREYISRPYHLGFHRLKDPFFKNNLEFYRNKKIDNISKLPLKKCKITGFQLLWVYVFFFIYLFTAMSLRVFSKYHQFKLGDLEDIQGQLTTGLIFAAPNVIVHFGIKLSVSKGFLRKIGSFFLCIIGLPIAAVTGLFNYVLPFKCVEKIPFLHSVQETWAENFIPSSYQIVLSQLFIFLELNALKSAVYEGEIDNSWDEITLYNLQSSHIVHKFINSCNFGFYFTIILCITYFFEYLNHNYIEEPEEFNPELYYQNLQDALALQREQNGEEEEENQKLNTKSKEIAVVESKQIKNENILNKKNENDENDDIGDKLDIQQQINKEQKDNNQIQNQQNSKEEICNSKEVKQDIQTDMEQPLPSPVFNERNKFISEDQQDQIIITNQDDEYNYLSKDHSLVIQSPDPQKQVHDNARNIDTFNL